MIRKLIPGALALSLVATVSAAEAAPATPEAAPAKTEAATPAVEIPATPKMDPAEMKTQSSYAIGVQNGSGFMQQAGGAGLTAADLDEAAFMKGFMSAMRNEKPDEKQIAKFQTSMQALVGMLRERDAALATVNLEASKKFLETNGKRDGVTTTKSGLQYEVITKGGEEKYVEPKVEKDAKTPPPEKEFLVNYKGMLINGKQFDASPEGKPVPMTLQVVPGFQEALKMMPVGAKWKLFLPADLAYGEKRRSVDIAPNSALVFELELVKIQDAAPPQGMMGGMMPPGAGGAPEEQEMPAEEAPKEEAPKGK